MKNTLIFAALAGIAAAIAIYFTSESNSKRPTVEDDFEGSHYVTDADIYNYDMQENTGAPQPVL